MELKLKNMCIAYLKPTGGVQWDGGGTVLLREAVAGVAVRRVVVAEASSNHTALIKVCRAALARVAAHAVLSAARLQDGLSGDGFPVLHVHKQPDKDSRPVSPIRGQEPHLADQMTVFIFLHLVFHVPVNVHWGCDFVKFMMSIVEAVFLFLLRMLLFPLAELQHGVLSCVYPHLKQNTETGLRESRKHGNKQYN